MAIDYSKRKSYQRIVAKAKSYSTRGKSSLKSQRKRLSDRRANYKSMIDAGVVNSTREGQAKLATLQKNIDNEDFDKVTAQYRTYTSEQQKVIKDVAKKTVPYPKKLFIGTVLNANKNASKQDTYTPPTRREILDRVSNTYDRAKNLKDKYGLGANILKGTVSKKGQFGSFDYKVKADPFGKDKSINFSLYKTF